LAYSFLVWFYFVVIYSDIFWNWFLILKHYKENLIFVLNDCIFVHFGLIRLRFLGKVLSAERANKLTGNNENRRGDQLGKDSKTSMLKNANVGKLVDGDTESRGLPIHEPIADRLGVNYPFPPHLEYAASSYLKPLSVFVALLQKGMPGANWHTNMINNLTKGNELIHEKNNERKL